MASEPRPGRRRQPAATRRPRRWASPSPRGCRCCCGARPAPARPRPSGPWREAIGWPCETVIASIREPSDFAGLPIVVGDGVRFAPPAWATRLAQAGRGLLFLDELSTAPPAVQAALLRVVLERVVGDLILPPDVAVVAAANPPEQAADGWDLSAPLANRLCHLNWDIDPLAVADGLAGGFTAPVVPRLPEGWEAEQHLALALVAAFLHARPALASAPPTDAATSAGRGWPSPRTWEMAARLWAASGAADAAEEARAALVAGSVGRRRGRRVPGLAAGDGPARPGGRAGRPGLVHAAPAGRPRLRRGGRDRRGGGGRPRRPTRWAAGWQVLGIAAKSGARRRRGRRADAGPLPPGRRAAARRGPAVRAGAARRRAAARMSRPAMSPAAASPVPAIPTLAAARLWAAARFPYLASAVFGARVVPVPGIGTVAVDQEWRLWADPELAAGWSAAELGSVLVHHVCHAAAGARRAGGPGRGARGRGRPLGALRRRRDQRRPGARPGWSCPATRCCPVHLGCRPRTAGRAVFRRRHGARAQFVREKCGPTAPVLDARLRQRRRRARAAVGGQRAAGGLPPWQARLLERLVAQECLAPRPAVRRRAGRPAALGR